MPKNSFFNREIEIFNDILNHYNGVPDFEAIYFITNLLRKTFWLKFEKGNMLDHSNTFLINGILISNLLVLHGFFY